MSQLDEIKNYISEDGTKINLPFVLNKDGTMPFYYVHIACEDYCITDGFYNKTGINPRKAGCPEMCKTGNIAIIKRVLFKDFSDLLYVLANWHKTCFETETAARESALKRRDENIKKIKALGFHPSQQGACITIEH